MPRNIEIKARIDSVESVLARASALADGPPQVIEQDDSFFRCDSGRLKLRTFADGTGELIHYHRPDEAGARASDYVRAPLSHPAAVGEALARGFGLLGRVRKRRLLLLAGATRIHLDRVEGLGDFLELEVVLRDGESDAKGMATAEQLMQALGLEQAPRVAGAYLDLLREPAGAGDPSSP